ncbi:TPA: glycosyltransferase family 2 protein [Citrobacter amalonaticus]|nr:glycosyltransferase family 2 protein [Citrobacter amalonaticus]
MMFISIVSHGHAELIINLKCLSRLSAEHEVILTDNVGESILEIYCRNNNIHYIKNNPKKGFGENNNQNFKYAINKLEMKPDDYFVVLNPDVLIEPESMAEVINIVRSNDVSISTINLVKPNNAYDCNIRKFPTFFNFIESYLFGKNSTIIDKSKITSDQYVDWASGSFLAIKAITYEKVGGFDERYFMYCEDLDLCKRISKITQEKVFYINSIKAIHHAAHNNRRLFSKHFLWHLKSVLRYCLISKY